MTVKDAILLAVPIIVAVIAGWFSYLQARKLADKNLNVEHEKALQTGRDSDVRLMNNLNKALSDEIEKLRADRAEDEARHRREVARLEEKQEKMETECMKQKDDLRLLSSWAATVVSILRRPDVAGLLAAGAVQIPAPPELQSQENR